MMIIVPDKVIDSINSFKRKDVRAAAFKIYAGLKKCEERKSQSTGYFDVPSKYLVSLNKRYNRIIDKFIEDGIIRYYTRPTQDENNLFNSVEKKYYNKTLGFCMKYKFLIDTEIGTEYNFDNENPNKARWFDVIKSSLIACGYDTQITRDTFGRRVHHPAIRTYKTDFANKGFAIIDANCSQPRLLYLLMKERGFYDNNYFNIFDNDEDFYLALMDKLGIESRDDGKDLFNSWTMGNGYVPNTGIFQLFSTASNFIKLLKTRAYKDAASYLQRQEARIWIDDLLENIPVNFALPIHDALIVRAVDANKVLSYCKQRHPEIKYTLKEL